MSSIHVKNVMTPKPVIVAPWTTLRDAAETMQTIGCGALPVGEGEWLDGIITDRDIVIRAVAQGKDVNYELVQDYMTPGIYYCQEDDSLQKAANLMRDYRVTRLVVRNSRGDITGIISFGCILRKGRPRPASTDMRHMSPTEAA